jgi:hypothetical protein
LEKQERKKNKSVHVIVFTSLLREYSYRKLISVIFFPSFIFILCYIIYKKVRILFRLNARCDIEWAKFDPNASGTLGESAFT